MITKVRLSKILEVYSEHSRTSKTELLVRIVNGWRPLTVTTILDAWLDSEYASVFLILEL